MSSYARSELLGSVVAPLTDSTKGSFGNRMDCARENMKNNATEYLKAAGVAGTVIAGSYVASKNPSVISKFATKLAGKVANLAKNAEHSWLDPNKFQKFNRGKLLNNISKVLDKAAMNPKAAAAAVLGTIAALSLGYISHNHAYKAGQIDQKYTDRAAIQKQTV